MIGTPATMRFERGAYEMEKALGKKFGFNKAYMEKIEEFLKIYQYTPKES